jgi:DNA-directed RNA polymerase specialized sigma24 family protein
MHQDQTRLNSEFEWMLQSSEVDDALLSEALIHKYYPGLYQLTLTVTDDPDTAAQVARYAISSAVTRRHRYSGEFSLRVWLYSMGYQAARKTGRKSSKPLIGEVWEQTGDQHANALSSLLFGLENKFSLPLILRCVHKLSLSEIGHVLGLRDRAVHNRFNSVRRKALAVLYPGSEKDPPHPEMGNFMRESLDGLFEGKNSFEYQARLEMHLDECRECTAYNALLSKTDEQIRASALLLWPVVEKSEAELKAVQMGMQVGTERKRMRQSLSLSLKTLSMAAMVVALFALLAFSTDIFGSATPEHAVQIDSGASLTAQDGQGNSPSHPSRSRPRPTGVGPTTRQDGYPLISGPYLPPRINLRLAPPGAILPQIIERLGWNNSGPLSLYNVLGYWGWQGELEDILADLQPDLDKNHVMPEEIVNYIYRETGLSSLWRFGGDLDTLKQVVAGGYPVIVAKGTEDANVPGWFAQYAIVHGYNDVEGIVRLVDLMLPDTEMHDLPYDEFISDWRSMNYTFLVVYPSLQEEQLFELLGEYADEVFSIRAASRLGSSESRSLSGRDKFFAAFNHATSHAYLGEYSRAASALDEAMTIYKTLPEDVRPWRIFMYEPSPYLVNEETLSGEGANQPVDRSLAGKIVSNVQADEECQDMEQELSGGRGGGGDKSLTLSVDSSEENILRLIACAQQ